MPSLRPDPFIKGHASGDRVIILTDRTRSVRLNQVLHLSTDRTSKTIYAALGLRCLLLSIRPWLVSLAPRLLARGLGGLTSRLCRGPSPPSLVLCVILLNRGPSDAEHSTNFANSRVMLPSRCHLLLHRKVLRALTILSSISIIALNSTNNNVLK